jgi:hypothetical protein
VALGPEYICKMGFTLEGLGFLWKHSLNSVERKLLLSTELRLCLQRKPHPSRVSRVKPGLQMYGGIDKR